MVGEWFQRFGDIPGVSHAAPAGIDRRRLPSADARPQVHTYDGERHLSWPGGEGSGIISTSASPAHERAFGVIAGGCAAAGLAPVRRVIGMVAAGGSHLPASAGWDG
jgi:hypothetical protein